MTTVARLKFIGVIVGFAGLTCVAGSALVTRFSDRPVASRFAIDRTKSTPLPSETERYAGTRVLPLQDKYPPLNAPQFVAASEANLLRENDEVLGLVLDGKPRAYPVRLVAYHHIVHDEIAENRFLVTYCNLCSSGVAFKTGDRKASFSTQGLWQGSLLMYDLETKSEWIHLTGECVKGPRMGEKLSRIPLQHVLWSEWKKSYPASEVMIPVDGVEYWFRSEVRRGRGSVPSRFAKTIQDVSNRLTNMELVLGVELAGESIAYPIRTMVAGHNVINDTIADVPIVVGVNPKTKSPFAFGRRLGQRTLEFTKQSDEILVETTTQSQFNHSGCCVSGMLEGQQLEPITSMQSAWYGWYASRTQTRVWPAEKLDAHVDRRRKPSPNRWVNSSESIFSPRFRRSH